MFVAQGHNIYKAAKDAPKHTNIIFAGKDSPSTKGARRALSKILGNNNVETHLELKHFFPFHEIEFAQTKLANMIQTVSLSR